MAVLIHTADLHLGECSMASDCSPIKPPFWTNSGRRHRRIRRCVLIAGDVFDRAVPPQAVDLLDEFLTAVVRDLDVPVVLILGTTTGGSDRLLARGCWATDSTSWRTDRADHPLVIEDRDGPSRSMASYLEPARVRGVRRLRASAPKTMLTAP